MLSPKSEKITANLGAWDADQKGLWLPVLVGSRLYQRSPSSFTDLEKRLDAVTQGSMKAKQLNETMVLIDRMGPVDATSDGSDGKFSTLDNREGFIEYALAALYGGVFWPRFVPVSVTTPIKVRW